MSSIVIQNTGIAKGSVCVVKLGGRSVETAEGRALLAMRLASLQAAGARLVVGEDGHVRAKTSVKLVVGEDDHVRAKTSVKLVVVHGGGAQVTAALAAAGIEARFVNGLRVTDARTLEVAEPVFAHVGKTVAHALSVAGAPALALTGRDALVVRATVKDPALGRVGTVTKVDAGLLRHLVFNGITPVVGPVAVDEEGPLNVNADEVASAVARAMGARELLLVTDVPAVRNGQGKPIPVLTPEGAQVLLETGAATGGMAPKIHGALDALQSGVGRVRVLDEPGLSKLAAGEEAGTLFMREA